ncbi:hypothetical protein B0H67DRAFT_583536, partial [Lasiosphaeris hirsuta]
MMADIYRSAKRVITYVGGPTPDIPKGIDLATKLIQLAKQRRGQPVNPIMYTRNPQSFGLPGFEDSSWDVLREFQSKPWCTRMWIVQESLLNDNICMQWGESTFGWDFFDEFFREVVQPTAYPQSSGLSPTDPKNGGNATQMFLVRDAFHRQGIKSFPMAVLLDLCRDLNCTDDKDRVFALMSLCNDSLKPTVDYTKDTRQVYIDAAVCMLLHHPGVLCSAGARKTIKHLPTWVPDWTVPAAQIPVLKCRGFQAGGPLQRWFTTIRGCNASAGTLKLSGLICGRVDHMTEKLQLVFTTARMARSRWARDQFMRLLKLGYYPGTRESYLDALWRTLICDLNIEHREAGKFRSMKPASPTLAHDFEAWVRPDPEAAKREANDWIAVRSGTGRMEPPDVDQVVYDAWYSEQNMSKADCGSRYPSNVFGSIQGNSPAGDSLGWPYRDAILRAGNLYRHLCTTEKGYIGVVPNETRVGDLLLFLPGAEVPFLLREMGVDSHYFLIGDCYIHGLMNGEALSNGDGRWEELTL